MISRFYCPVPLSPGAVVELPADAAHHAARVLRLQAGEPVCLFNGRGGQWQGRLVRVGKTVTVALETYHDDDGEPPLPVTVVQAVPAADKMDWIVQKGVELGAAAFRPVVARRSVIRLSGERRSRREQHWQAVAVAACEQCGRNRPPPVAPLVELPQFLGEAPAERELRLVLAPGAERRLSQLPRPAGPVSLLIGPEGGFEDDELRAAVSVGFTPIGLGPRVLRTETAGLAALAAMMALWGDF